VTNSNEEVIRRLDALIRLTAITMFKDKSQKEKIAILNLAGLTPKEIADFLDTTSNTVSVALSSMKKDKDKEKSSKRAKRTPKETHEQ
jgi:DNA-binding NarL/FixJ family response regulator